MKNLVLISYTSLSSPGGVPRWNRDFVNLFPGTKHYSWEDFLREQSIANEGQPLNEWDKAQVLGTWLGWSKKVGSDTIVLADGFWAAGVSDFVPRDQIISVAHGNWSHTTKDDVEKGILPEFPEHHRVQLNFRKKHLASGGKIVAVSDFIAHQCKIQWDMDMPVINNGIDLDRFIPALGSPAERKSRRKRPIVIHMTTTTNKGFDHIDAVRQSVNADVWLLDEAAERMGLLKYQALAQADVVVHPSAHEGNSYGVLETLSCDVPIVSYDVGLMYRAKKEDAPVGFILDRRQRSPEQTIRGVEDLLIDLSAFLGYGWRPRQWVSQFSLSEFGRSWREYLTKEFGDAVLPS